MSDLHANSGALPDHYSRLGASALAGWQTIGEQRGFYDEQDCLDPNHNLASDELQNRKEDDVVIFDYFLDPDYLTCASGNPNPLVEGGCPSSRQFNPDNGIFFQVSKNELIKSKQFDRIINSPPLSEGGPRLGVM